MLTAIGKRILVTTMFFVSLLSGPAYAETVLVGAGATFPYPLYSKWFRDYSAVDPTVSFSYEPIGSGGGIKKIMEHSVDFSASDKFLTDQELKHAPGKILHIPTVIGAVAVTYNVPGIGSGLKLTPEVLADIFLGRISRWNDRRLIAMNPGMKLPDQPVVVFYRADRSGTTSIFTDYLSSISQEWSEWVGRGTTVAWPVGAGAKGSAEVVKQVQGTPYSISYVEVAYAVESGLAVAQLKNRNGQFVKPSMLSTRAAAVSALKKVKKDYRVSLVNQPGREAYPIVGITWLLVYQQQEPEKGKKLVEFLKWELRHAEKMTSTLYYTPLPEKLADMVEKTIDSISYRK